MGRNSCQAPLRPPMTPKIIFELPRYENPMIEKKLKISPREKKVAFYPQKSEMTATGGRYGGFAFLY